MEIEIFYNAGGADILKLEYLRDKTQVNVRTAHTLAKQMSECGLVYSTRLHGAAICKGDAPTIDYRNGVEGA